MAREFLPEMIKRNSGHIVGIVSLSSVASVVNLSLYAATKHGVLGTFYDFSLKHTSTLNTNVQFVLNISN